MKKKGAAIISWKKDSSVSKYEITYSTDKNFSKGVKKVVTTNKKQKTIKGFKENKTYYIRVRSCKKVGKKTYYSKYSAVKKAKF